MSLLNSFEEFEKVGEVGDWCFQTLEDGRLMLFLRYPIKEEYANLGDYWEYSMTKKQGDIVRIPLSGTTEKPWNWNGNREFPTITPSINVVGRWHGFLTNGKIITL